MSAGVDHADVGGRPRVDGAPPMPPVTWDPSRQPTPGEWVAYFVTLSGRQKEYLAGTMLGYARRGAACMIAMHDELLEQDTLSRAQISVQAHLDDPGLPSCPCCGQTAKRYRRKINAQMANALIKAYVSTRRSVRLGAFTASTEENASNGVLVEGGKIYLHFPTLLGKTADEAKLAYWALIESLPAQREDGSARTGWWALTQLGRYYAEDKHQVPTYALVFDGTPQGFDGPLVGIRQALGTRFNYDDLIGGK